MLRGRHMGQIFSWFFPIQYKVLSRTQPVLVFIGVVTSTRPLPRVFGACFSFLPARFPERLQWAGLGPTAISPKNWFCWCQFSGFITSGTVFLQNTFVSKWRSHWPLTKCLLWCIFLFVGWRKSITGKYEWLRSPALDTDYPRGLFTGFTAYWLSDWRGSERVTPRCASVVCGWFLS